MEPACNLFCPEAGQKRSTFYYRRGRTLEKEAIFVAVSAPKMISTLKK